MGVTGARRADQRPRPGRSWRAPAPTTDLPVGVGLGVSNGDQAAEVAAYADGVIVGSAFVRTLLDHPDDRAAGLRRAGRAHRGPRRRGAACVAARPGSSPLVLAVSPARRRAATDEPAAEGGYHGAVLEQPYVVPETPLTDTDGEPYSLAADTDKPLTLVFFGYTHCPDICQVVMANLASALTRLDEARPRAGRRGLRDHRPGARRRADAAHATSTGSTRRSSGSPATCDDDHRRRQAARGRGRAGREAAERRLRGHPRHPGDRDRRRRPGARSCGPRAPPRPTSPPTSTSCSPETGMIAPC